jgi:hypothetical protein
MALFTPSYNPNNWKVVFPFEKKLEPLDRALPAVPAAEKAGIDKFNADLEAKAQALEKKGESGKKEAAALRSKRRTFPKLQALYEVGPPPPTHLLIRGNHETPGPKVSPGFLKVLCDQGAPDWVPATPVASGTSGRRLALARWLTADGSRASGLVARVMVNRVWQHLFGRGIVATPENFGLGGEPPSHPELLEWLSAEFLRGGWRLKPLIKQVMVSSAYRQSSEPPGAAEDDPENRLFGRMPLKRLEADVIRDAILAVGGKLDPVMGGPPVMTEAKLDGTVVVDKAKLPYPAAAGRRSVYLLTRHAFHPTLMTVFDQPVLATNCPERSRSAVPLQSLALMNDAFLFEQAEAFAARLERRPGCSAGSPIEAAFLLAFGRPPLDAERAWCGEFLGRQARLYTGTDAPRKALADLCHTLLGASEFLYAP